MNNDDLESKVENPWETPAEDLISTPPKYSTSQLRKYFVDTSFGMAYKSLALLPGTTSFEHLGRGLAFTLAVSLFTDRPYAIFRDFVGRTLGATNQNSSVIRKVSADGLSILLSTISSVVVLSALDKIDLDPSRMMIAVATGFTIASGIAQGYCLDKWRDLLGIEPALYKPKSDP